MKLRGKRPIALILFAVLTAGPGLAQSVKPEAIPPDPEAESQAAMKDKVHDPRVEKSQKGGNDWGMWDIGRPHPMQGKGEFGGADAIGVAAGKLIPTDCSLYWNDPDSHKILCFSSQASLVYFLDAPGINKARAEKRWREMGKKPAS
ncbi:MAG: hypothetical protein WDN02_14130 [Methylovirgula sp.]|uniref:hypothetical protein n=1 Tax=Methylovirgula sp. TaxID=1978224 RepID=UPI0030762162